MPSLADYQPPPATADILEELAAFPAYLKGPGSQGDILGVARALIGKAEGTIRALSTYAEGKAAEAQSARSKLAIANMASVTERGKLDIIRDLLNIDQ